MVRQSSPEYSEEIRIPWFRRCRLGEDKVEVTPPKLFGSGFIFDRSRRVVSIRLCLFGRTLHKEEIPFSDISIRLNFHERQAVPSHNVGKHRDFFIELIGADGTRLKVCDGVVAYRMRPPPETQRIVAAIQDLLAPNNE
jgi:hypothetical protein